MASLCDAVDKLQLPRLPITHVVADAMANPIVRTSQIGRDADCINLQRLAVLAGPGRGSVRTRGLVWL